jgi:hypothetical protein
MLVRQRAAPIAGAVTVVLAIISAAGVVDTLSLDEAR